MNPFLQMLDIQAVLMLYAVGGVICRKKGIITLQNQQQFIEFLLFILMPCMIFNSFKSITLEILYESFYILLISLASCFVAMILGKYLYRNFPAEKQNILRYATLINNANFLGLPLVEEAFGSQGLIYASVFLIPIRIFMWSSGVTLLSNQKVGKQQIFINIMKHPCVIAVYLGMLRGFLQYDFPPFLETALSKMSACVSPVSMIIIGAIIADVNIKTIFDKDIILYSVVRLVGLPLAMFAATSLLGFNQTIVGTATLLTAMPAAAATALLAAHYRLNVEFASKLVFVTIMLSLVTTPVLMLLLK